MEDIKKSEVKSLLIEELARYKLDYDCLKKRIGMLHEGEVELSGGDRYNMKVTAMMLYDKTIVVRASAYSESGVFSIYPKMQKFTVSPDNIISS